MPCTTPSPFAYFFLGFAPLPYQCQCLCVPGAHPRSSLKVTMSQNLLGPTQNHNKNTSRVDTVLRQILGFSFDRRTRLNPKIWPDSNAYQANPSPPRSTLKETMSQNLLGPTQNHNKNTSRVNRVLRQILGCFFVRRPLAAAQS